MKLSKKARKKLSPEPVRMRIALDINKSLATFYRMINKDDERLTQLNVIESIKRHTGLQFEEIFETETEKA